MKKSKKKLAMVISSLEVGGAEKMVLDLLSKLKSHFIVKLFVVKSNKNSIYDFEAKKLNIDIIYFNHKIKVFSPLVAFRMKKALEEFKPDIIHSNLKASTYIYFYNLFKKDFLWVHTVHTLANIDTKILRRLFLKPLYNSGRIKLIAVSNTVKKSCEKLYKEANVIVIPNGIDLMKFEFIKREEELINFISVGRLEKVKNHLYLIKEFAKIVDNSKVNKLYLIGSGKSEKEIRKLIKELNLENYVELVAYTNKVNEYLNKSDIFITTSLYEGMPLSVIEAMASGLLVIASSASSEIIINDYNGIIIDLDENSLFNKLNEVISNLDNFKTLRNNALIDSKQYNLENMAEKYINIYLEGLK